jgi:hypothetical protein
VIRETTRFSGGFGSSDGRVINPQFWHDVTVATAVGETTRFPGAFLYHDG